MSSVWYVCFQFRGSFSYSILHYLQKSVHSVVAVISYSPRSLCPSKFTLANFSFVNAANMGTLLWWSMTRWPNLKPAPDCFFALATAVAVYTKALLPLARQSNFSICFCLKCTLSFTCASHMA